MRKFALVLLVALVLLPYCAKADSYEVCNCTKCYTQLVNYPSNPSLSVVTTNTCTVGILCTPQVNNSVTSCWNINRTGQCDVACATQYPGPNNGSDYVVYSMATWKEGYPSEYHEIPTFAGSLSCSDTVSCPPAKRSVQEEEEEEEEEEQEQEREREQEQEQKARAKLNAQSGAPEELVYTVFNPKQVACYSTSSSSAIRNTLPSGTPITPFTCGVSCSENGWQYSGVTMVSGAAQCYCAAQLSGTTTSGCTTQCPDQPSYTCGGTGAIQVMANIDGFRVCSTMPSGTFNATSYLGSSTGTSCQQACAGLGYAYAGTYNFGQDCVCTNTEPSTWTPTALPEGDCEENCMGDSTQTLCGSTTAVSFWTSWSFLTSYKGCFTDAATRDMNLFSYTGTVDVNECIDFCLGHGTAYAGMEDSNQCFCGNTYDNYGAASPVACSMQCSGDATEICGGSYALSVYSTAGFVDADVGALA